MGQYFLLDYFLSERVLMKGEVLGTVDNFYWKKEYQACGAPHYHILLWIKDAPVIGPGRGARVDSGEDNMS